MRNAFEKNKKTIEYMHILCFMVQSFLRRFFRKNILLVIIGITGNLSSMSSFAQNPGALLYPVTPPPGASIMTGGYVNTYFQNMF